MPLHPPTPHPQVRIVRIFNTYGPRMALDDGRVVSNFVSQALRGEPLTLFGDGKQTRSFQYVADLIKGERPRDGGEGRGRGGACCVWRASHQPSLPPHCHTVLV